MSSLAMCNMTAWQRISSRCSVRILPTASRWCHCTSSGSRQSSRFGLAPFTSTFSLASSPAVVQVPSSVRLASTAAAWENPNEHAYRPAATNPNKQQPHPHASDSSSSTTITAGSSLSTNSALSLEASSSTSTASSSWNRIPSDLERLIDEYCRKEQTCSSIQLLMKTGRGELQGKSYKTEAFMGRLGQRLATHRILLQFATFLRHELPIRLAHRIRDLDTMPIMRDMKAVQDVKGIYIQSFLELIDFPPIHSAADEESFATTLEHLYTKHSSVLVQIAKGAYEFRETVRAGKGGAVMGRSGAGTGVNRQRTNLLGNYRRTHPPHLQLKQQQRKHEEDEEKATALLDFVEQMEECNKFLDRFYTSRIGIRVLAGQYLALREKPRPDYIGMICQKTSPSEVVRQAAEDVKKICRKKYGRSPEIELMGCMDLTFPYIPTYLHYIVLELLKNAARATSEHHKHSEYLPPVTVIIADGTENEDVVIKIADEGGGIPRSRIDKIWSYLYTTADGSLQEAIFSGRDHSNVSPIAGLGYGLPISRSYCRYFGGDIDLMSMDGHGTDVFVYMKRLGDTKEPIPI